MGNRFGVLWACNSWDYKWTFYSTLDIPHIIRTLCGMAFQKGIFQRKGGVT